MFFCPTTLLNIPFFTGYCFNRLSQDNTISFI